METFTNLAIILEPYKLWGNTAWDYTLALGVFLLTWFVLKIIKWVIVAKLKKWAKKTKTKFDDAIIDIFCSIKFPFYLIASIYIASRFLIITGITETVLKFLMILAVVYEVVRAGEKITTYALKTYAYRDGRDKKDESIIQAGRLLAKIVLWTIGLLLIMSNLGINVTSLVASLGIGGIAVALAAQNILSDIFSSFSIYIDKPFEVGDSIVIGTDRGTVEKIGMKTTRIRTLRGEELIVSNKELTSVRVQNMKKMEERRDDFRIGVEYGMTKTKLKSIPRIVKKVIKTTEHLRFERCNFVEFGESALIFEIVYFVDTRDYDTFVDAKHKMNVELFSTFESEGIYFAYPTQTVHVVKEE